MAYKDEYGIPMPDGFTYDELISLITLAQASWSAEQIKIWGNDRTTSLGHDMVRHVLLAAEQLKVASSAISDQKS